MEGKNGVGRQEDQHGGCCQQLGNAEVGRQRCSGGIVESFDDADVEGVG